MAESAVVGYPHDIKGEGVYAYVILKDGVSTDSKTEAELRAIVRQKIAAYALPDVIQVIQSEICCDFVNFDCVLLVLHWTAENALWQDNASHLEESGCRSD